MRGTFRLSEPDKVEASLTLTMPLLEWKNLRKQLEGDGWPASRLSLMITVLVNAAERQFSETEKETP